MRALFAAVLVASAGLTVASVAVMSSAGDRAARTLGDGAAAHVPGAGLIAETDRAARTALQGALQVAINDTDEVRGAAYGAVESFAGQCATYTTRATQCGVSTADVEAFSKSADVFAQSATKLIRTPTNRDSYLAAVEAFAVVSEQLRKTQAAHEARSRDTLAAAHAHTQLWTGVSVTLGLLGAAGMIAGVAGFMHAWRKDSAAHRSEVDMLNFASQESANASQARTNALAQIAEQFAPALDGVANYATQLGQPEASPAERAAVANGLAAQARAMGSTLHALREFIQIDSGNLSLQRVVVPVAVTVRETVEAMNPHLPEGTGLRIDVDANVPQRVMFDRDKLRLAIAGLVGLGADDARAGLSQAEAWRMAPTPHGDEQAENSQPAAVAAPTWIGSHLRIGFDADVNQLTFTLRTPVRDMTDETLQGKLSPLNDVTRMKDASWRRWLDLAITDRVATLSGGQAFTRVATDDACVVRVCMNVGVMDSTPGLGEAIVLEFGAPMPAELRETAKPAAEGQQAEAAQAETQRVDGEQHADAAHVDAGEHAEHPAANIPITDANVAATADCSDAGDLHDGKPGRKAA
ncbi:MAG: hypothetical protein ACK5ZG_10855 [Phycisphaerae bacterium]